MSSSRTGSGLPARPSEGRAQRLAMAAATGRGIPRPAQSVVRDHGTQPSVAPATSSQSRLPARVQQPSSYRHMSKPSSTQQEPTKPKLKLTLKHQPASWGSETTSHSVRSNSHTQSGSGSSTSSRSHEGRNLARRNNAPVSRIVPPTSDKLPPPIQYTPMSSHPRSSLEQSLGSPRERSQLESPVQPADHAAPTPVLSQSPVIYPELDRYRHYQRPAMSSPDHGFELPFKLSTQDLPPPTPASLLFSGSSSQMSASPSTKFSGSPGPGPYSRDTTPTSLSSHSPGLSAPSRLVFPKGRQPSPALTRPPVTRRRAGSTPHDTEFIDPQGLAAVRESLTSSSSNSTVKEGDKGAREKKKTTPSTNLPPPPPSPPPRKSSQKFRQDRDDDDDVVVVVKAKTKPRSASSSKLPSPQKPVIAPTRIRSPMASPVAASAPRRPSRDGASNIDSQLLGPAPIIHSNLSSTSLPGDRRGMEVKDVASSYQHARNASTSQLPVGRTSSSDVDAKNVATSGLRKLEVPEAAGAQSSRTPSPSVGSSSFRFPFFGRKKTPAESPPKPRTDKDKKPAPPARKGPAAGTGHEGYGRVGAIRRRSGTSNLAAKAAASTSNMFSQESLVSNDSFLADRMNPVVIAGGEVVQNRNASAELSRTESNQSLVSMNSKAGTEFSTTSRTESRTAYRPADGATSRQLKPPARRPSDSSDSDGVGMQSTLAFRRSVQRLRSSPDNPLRLPQPINTSGAASSPMTSFDTSIMSDESLFETEVSPQLRNVGPKKLVKKRDRSPRKWNLFGRGQSQKPLKKSEQTPPPMYMDEKKSTVAFYTMMDSSEHDESDKVDIQQVLRNADVYPPPEDMVHSIGDVATPPFDEDHLNLMVPQPLPLLQKVYHDPAPPLPQPLQAYPPPPAPTLRSGRPSRLQQVGRIPKVISNRPDHHASPRSFSRPFRASMQVTAQPSEYFDPESIAMGPSPPRTVMEEEPDDAELEYTVASPAAEAVTTPIEAPFQGHQRRASPVTGQAGREFIQFSPRKNSDATMGTSSSSSGANTFTGATAVIPQPEDPLAEDEVWDEYNDLLEVGDQAKHPRLSGTSSRGVPFHLEVYSNRRLSEKPMESPTIVADSRKMSVLSMAPTVSSTYSADMTERIRAAFQPHPSPKTPNTPSEFKVEFEEKPVERKKSTTELRRRSLSPVMERASDSSYSSAEEGSPLAQVNLRVGSMTVSKWLTFGHVLFSDVRHELVKEEDPTKRHSILVIDGLGNDDWSFYAAETYPAATFFNLSPRAPLPPPVANSPTSFPQSPPNHHQIQYLSYLDKFPFAAQSFTAVVYRFPVAAPEAHYRNILAEARRVLKPGGYLELSILDVDLNNMGSRGRKAVRQLKERIHEATPETNLASTADLMVRQIGKAGFYGIRAARVGVPVASSIARAHGGIKVHHTKDGSGSPDKKSKKKDQPSLSEMMSDTSSTADENITKMVARVGRWWYTRCYESAADSTLSSSIWSDKALLRECEEMGTSLKLMVCCGRAPDRVASV